MKRIIGFLFFLVLVFSCTHNKPMPSGYEMLERNNKGQVLVQTFKAVKSAKYWAPPKAGYRGTLLLGQKDNYKSCFVLRFTGFASIDSASVQSATLKLYQFSHTNSSAGLQVSIYPVTAPWVSTAEAAADWEDARWDDVKNNINTSSLLGTMNIVPQDTTIINSAQIDPAIVNEWITHDDDDTGNYGIAVMADQADFIAEFYSSDASSGFPSLDIIFTNTSGVLDTVNVIASYDASLIEYTGEVPAYQLQEDIQDLTIGSGSGYRSFLKFDLESLPNNATVHHALLELNVNTGLGQMIDSTGILINIVRVVEDSTWGPTTFKLDTVNTSASALAYKYVTPFDVDGTDAVASIAPIVQYWIWNDDKNYGLFFKSLSEGYDISELHFYSGMSDSALVPTLRVTYSLPPDNRF